MYDTWNAGQWRPGVGRAYNSIGAIKRSLRGMLRTTGRQRIPSAWDIVKVKSIKTAPVEILAKHLVLVDPLAIALDGAFGTKPSRRRRKR